MQATFKADKHRLPVHFGPGIPQRNGAVQNQTVSLSQQTQYDVDFLPVIYQLAAETPSGTQIVSAQLGLSGLEMEVRVGLARQTATVSDTTDLALLDNNLISQYVVLLAAIRAEALDREFTAAIPQALLSLPGRIDGPNSIEFRSGRGRFDGKRFEVHLGDTMIVLIESGGHLVGLINPAQGTVGYDVSRFPAGIEVDLIPSAGTDVEGVDERDIALATDGLTLYGTLALPSEGDGPFPAALFVAGSGASMLSFRRFSPAALRVVRRLSSSRSPFVSSDVSIP